MDILDDMGVSKLSAKVFSKVNYSFKDMFSPAFFFFFLFLRLPAQRTEKRWSQKPQDSEKNDVRQISTVGIAERAQ